MSSGSARRRANIANTSLGGAGTAAGAITGIMAAAGAANAVPVAGQVASAVLAIGGALTMLFAGKKQRKREEAQLRQRQQIQANRQDITPQATQNLNIQGGQQPQESIQQTVATPMPETPTLQYNDGGQQPTVRPQRLGGF